MIPTPSVAMKPKVKELCLKMYCNGMGFRQIERCTDVCHNTVINWVKKSAKALPKQPTIEAIPEVGELDELQTFVGKKKLNMAVDSSKSL
jgi:hypothetical protein